MTRRHRHCGFTLVEALTASVILALCIVAVSVCMRAGHQASQDAGQGRLAVKLAEELTEYILSLPYYDDAGTQTPGPEAGETGASAFDNADDFHGYSDPEGTLTDMSGSAYPAEYQVFTRSVSAQYGSVSVAGLGGPVGGLTVVVQVNDRKGRTWEVTRFIPQPID
ncbi:MAG: prepilin-type N-terminal cleavage/methylation domain-containing protein [Phycisphaerae bacterium]